MKFSYKEYGDQDAPFIVFLHGGGVSSWMWEHQVRHFTNYHCVTVDLPEQGKSTQCGPFSIENSADQISEFIHKLANGKDVIVVGFSLGAQVLIQILSESPNLIHYAMINSALVKPNKLGGKLINPLLRLTYPLIQNRTFAKLQAKTLFIDEHHFETYYNESSQMERETLARILKENMSFHIPSGFEKAKANILVTVGAKEKSVMKKSAVDIVNSNDHCTGVIISEVGHGAPLSHPKLFNEMIEKWIDGEELPRNCEIIE